MKPQAILFDLDGTLLPMDQDAFTQVYFTALSQKMQTLGYDPKQLIDGVWKGTGAMVLNNGEKRNEERFWETFAAVCGNRVYNDKEAFDAFYRSEFQTVQTACGFNAAAAQTVRYCREQGVPVILATNPIFPAVATESRIRWAGLEPSDFLFYTTYENSRYCKPNPAYYQEIVDRAGVDPRACLMVGNDTAEDIPAEQIGMKVFLLTDTMINKKNVDLTPYPHGDFAALRAYLEETFRQ